MDCDRAVNLRHQYQLGIRIAARHHRRMKNQNHRAADLCHQCRSHSPIAVHHHRRMKNWLEFDQVVVSQAHQNHRAVNLRHQYHLGIRIVAHHHLNQAKKWLEFDQVVPQAHQSHEKTNKSETTTSKRYIELTATIQTHAARIARSKHHTNNNTHSEWF